MEEEEESMVDSSVSSAGDFCSDEYCSEASGESSWTMYLEDFMASEDHQKKKASTGAAFSRSSGGAGAAADSTTAAHSFVSDAASCVVSVTSTSLQTPASEGYNKRLKRRKAWPGHLLQDDDPLEDTATSPVSSPKVMEPSKKEDDHRGTSHQLQEGDVNHRINGAGPKKELANGFNPTGKANDCTELRRRGICLVPISMLVNYLG